MANIPIIDVTGGTAYTKGTGAGSSGDPYVPQPNVSGTVNIAGTVPVSGTVGVSGTVPVRTTNDGTVSVSSLPGVAGTVEVSNFPATQAVSVAALPLPSGAATSANQSTLNTKIDTLLTQTDGLEGSLSSIDGKLPAAAAAEHITANSPHAARLSDGAAFYKGLTEGGTVNVAGTVPVRTTNDGTVSVSNFPATQAISGTVGVSGTVPVSGTVALSGTVNTLERGGTVVAQLQPVTAGGLSTYRDINAGTAGQVVKASAGQLYGYYLANTGTVTAYFKLYNKATAPGTADTPVLTLPLFGTAAANVAFPNGVEFTSGIGVRVTTGVGDTDATTPAGSVCVVNLNYK